MVFWSFNKLSSLEKVFLLLLNTFSGRITSCFIFLSMEIEWSVRSVSWPTTAQLRCFMRDTMKCAYRRYVQLGGSVFFSLMWTLWLNKADLPFKSYGSSDGRCSRTLTTMSDDKIFSFILEIGYCSHMMYRAKYVLVSLHLCTTFLPPFPCRQ